MACVLHMGVLVRDFRNSRDGNRTELEPNPSS